MCTCLVGQGRRASLLEEMYNKRTLPCEEVNDIPPEKRFRADMIDIFLNNDLSGQRSARVLGNASLAGTQHIEDLQVAPGKNAYRNLLRKCFRNTKWPAPYELQVTAFNEATDAEEKSKLCMLMPHEVVHALLKVNDPRVLLEHQRAILAERPDLEHLANFDLAKDDKALLLGLWIDGVPFNSDRSQTLETITLRLFGEKGLRVLFRRRCELRERHMSAFLRHWLGASGSY